MPRTRRTPMSTSLPAFAPAVANESPRQLYASGKAASNSSGCLGETTNVKGSSSTSEIGATGQCGQEALEDNMFPSIYGQSSGRTRANYEAPRFSIFALTENTSPPIQSSSVVCVGVQLISATPAR
ncbi:hypothetical protein NL676_039569 [Syzygium grande]|nr:hypothetical protein NL676_039569 [Syzygium grande]